MYKVFEYEFSEDVLNFDLGMKKGSENFGGELFDAMCRRRYMYEESIDKALFKEFWEQISEPKFEYRLRTFFDM
jgi:respiratory burst oxidase